jgi:HD-GYP domain-containing protein (c-di-GMP phosphodiesterase class II)
MVLDEQERYFIDRMRSRVLLMLLSVIEIHEQSTNTARHSDRVATVCSMFGSDLNLPYRERAALWRCCLLHDLGKIGIGLDILNSKRGLSKYERLAIELHPLWGARILKISDIFKYEALVVVQHHEHWDGTGYPYGLSGKQIHLYARIIHIVDVYDALTTFRGYKDQWTPIEAIKHIYKKSGKMFDPDLVKMFMRISETQEFKNIYF